MLLSSIVIRHSAIHGSGLFSTAPIPLGTAVWLPCPACPVLRARAVSELGAATLAWFDEYGYRLVDQSLLLPCSNAHLMNHSCQPNVLDFGLDFALAVRDIEPGEEVSCDFRTFASDPNWRMICRCGCHDCGGEIQPGQGTDLQLQQRWLERVHAALERLRWVDQPLRASLTQSSALFGAIRDRAWHPSLPATHSIRAPHFIFDRTGGAEACDAP
jgi:hypothetical protein